MCCMAIILGAGILGIGAGILLMNMTENVNLEEVDKMTLICNS